MTYFTQKEYGPILVRGFDGGGQFIGEIWMNGIYWDCIGFDTRSQLDRWLSDPFADERAKAKAKTEREEKNETEMIRYRAAGYERISTGRKIGRKTGLG